MKFYKAERACGDSILLYERVKIPGKFIPGEAVIAGNVAHLSGPTQRPPETYWTNTAWTRLA